MRSPTIEREWTVLALAVRTENVHVVIAAEATADEVMTALTAAATRALKRWHCRRGRTCVVAAREHPLPVEARALDDAVRYVMEGQDVPRT